MAQPLPLLIKFPKMRTIHKVSATPARAAMLNLLLALILGFCGYIMVFGTGELGGFRTAAWSVISGVAGAIGSKLFGASIFQKTQE